MSVGIAYIRVSSERQDLGPVAQRNQITAWAERTGVTIAAWHEERGVSGATPVSKRPALLAAIAELRERGATVLVAAKRDRVARDVVVAETVDRLVSKEGAVVRTADGMSDGGGSTGVLQRGIVDVFAQYERAVIRERTTAALAVKRAKGERIGTVPYGYSAGAAGMLVPNPSEQTTIQTIRELRAEGASMRRIVEELAARGVVGRTGRPLAQTQVVRILR